MAIDWDILLFYPAPAEQDSDTDGTKTKSTLNTEATTALDDPRGVKLEIKEYRSHDINVIAPGANPFGSGTGQQDTVITNYIRTQQWAASIVRPTDPPAADTDEPFYILDQFISDMITANATDDFNRRWKMAFDYSVIESNPKIYFGKVLDFKQTGNVDDLKAKIDITWTFAEDTFQ